MNNTRKKMKFEYFFERFFANFFKMLLVNLLFAIPSAVVFVGFYFLNHALFDGINIAFSFLTIIPLYPFYAGVVMVVRDIVKGEQEIHVASTYFKAIRMNFLPFLLHGTVICGAAVLSYFALYFYIQMLSVSWIMYGLLFICFIIVLMVLYISFYLPQMTITYDIKLRYVYKNSFLMSFGEFKNNFVATIAVAIFLSIFLTCIAFIRSKVALIIVLSSLWTLLLPSLGTYCYVFFTYDGMVDMIENKDAHMKEFDAKAASKDSKKDKPESGPSLDDEDFSDIDISKLKDTDVFIYHNGRMVKQSTVLRILRDREAAGEVDKDE